MMPVLLLTNATVELYRLYASDPKRHAMRQVSFPITLFLELYHDLIIMNTFEYPFLTIAHH